MPIELIYNPVIDKIKDKEKIKEYNPSALHLDLYKTEKQRFMDIQKIEP